MTEKTDASAQELLGDEIVRLRQSPTLEEVASRLNDTSRAIDNAASNPEAALGKLAAALDAASETAAELHADSQGELRKARRQRETKRLNRRLENDIGTMAVTQVHLESYLACKSARRKRDRQGWPSRAHQAGYTLRQFLKALTPAEEAREVAGGPLRGVAGSAADRLDALGKAETADPVPHDPDLDADIEAVLDLMPALVRGHGWHLRRDMRLDDVDAAVRACPALAEALRDAVERAEPLIGEDDLNRRAFLNSVGLSEEVVQTRDAEPQDEPALCGMKS